MIQKMRSKNVNFRPIFDDIQDIILPEINISLNEKDFDTGRINEEKHITVLEKKTSSDSIELF